MAKNCVVKLKSQAPDLYEYLKGKVGFEYDGSVEAKQAWKDASRQLQNNTLDILNNVYADLGVSGYNIKTITPPPTKTGNKNRGPGSHHAI